MSYWTLDLDDLVSFIGRLDSSLADVAALHVSGVVGLALVKSGFAGSFGMDLERGWRTVQWRWSGGGGGGWGRLKRRRVSATMESSARAKLTQSRSHIWWDVFGATVVVVDGVGGKNEKIKRKEWERSGRFEVCFFYVCDEMNVLCYAVVRGWLKKERERGCLFCFEREKTTKPLSVVSLCVREIIPPGPTFLHVANTTVSFLLILLQDFKFTNSSMLHHSYNKNKESQLVNNNFFCRVS